MVIGIGIDLVQLHRIRKMYDRYGERFARHILAPGELAAMPLKAIPYIGSRFAAKEAAVKALGTGFINGIIPASIEVYNDRHGKPCLNFTGQAKIQANNLCVEKVMLSLSHEQDYAVAMVILEN